MIVPRSARTECRACGGHAPGWPPPSACSGTASNRQGWDHRATKSRSPVREQIAIVILFAATSDCRRAMRCGGSGRLPPGGGEINRWAVLTLWDNESEWPPFPVGRAARCGRRREHHSDVRSAPCRGGSRRDLTTWPPGARWTATRPIREPRHSDPSGRPPPRWGHRHSETCPTNAGPCRDTSGWRARRRRDCSSSPVA
jgi:hypothetical protein